MLVAYILPVCALLAPCDPGASPPEYVTVILKGSTKAVTRIIVLGSQGFFGAAAVDLLRREGERPVAGSRRPGSDLLIDAENPSSLRAALRDRDVVIDAAAPFQRRSTVLVETALAIGCDVIDISDSLEYALKVQRLAHRIDGTGTRVLTSCSSVCAV